MKIHSAEFVRGITSPKQFGGDGLPEAAFAGRSNVGKSSLINCLLRRKRLARTSNTPGRTQEINVFRVNDTYDFVDLPGFGYAKVPEAKREAWGRLITAYLERSERLRVVVLLIDARHGPQTLDMQMLDWLLAADVPFFPVLTKVDKVPKSKRGGLRGAVRRASPVLEACEPVLFSAQTGEGRDLLLDRLEAHLEAPTG